MNPQQQPSAENGSVVEPTSPQVSSPLHGEQSTTEASGGYGGQSTHSAFSTPESLQPTAEQTSSTSPEQPVQNTVQVFGPQQTVGPTAPSFSPSGSPAASSPQQNTYMSSSMTQAKKRRLPGKKFALVLAALLTLGLGGGAYAYVSIMNNSPEKVLADALANTMTDVLDKKPLQVVSNIKFESKDSSMPYSVEVDMDAKQVDDNGQFGATVHVKASSAFDLTVTASTIVQGTEAAYVKLDNVQKTVDQVVAMNPALAPSADMIKPFVQKIDSKWIKLDEKSLKDMGVSPGDVELDACAEALKGLRISQDDKKRLKEIYKNNQFAIASEELPGELVDGDASYHYKLDFNEESGIRFAKEVYELESFAAVKKDCNVKQEDLDKELENIKKQTDKEQGKMPVFELWVSKKTRHPTKVKVNYDDKEFTFEFIATTKINAQNLRIEIPTESISLDELKTEFEKTMQEVGQTKGWSDFRP